MRRNRRLFQVVLSIITAFSILFSNNSIAKASDIPDTISIDIKNIPSLLVVELINQEVMPNSAGVSGKVTISNPFNKFYMTIGKSQTLTQNMVPDDIQTDVWTKLGFIPPETTLNYHVEFTDTTQAVHISSSTDTKAYIVTLLVEVFEQLPGITSKSTSELITAFGEIESVMQDMEQIGGVATKLEEIYYDPLSLQTPARILALTSGVSTFFKSPVGELFLITVYRNLREQDIELAKEFLKRWGLIYTACKFVVDFGISAGINLARSSSTSYVDVLPGVYGPGIPPAAPRLITPIGTNISNPPLFQWGKVLRVSEYILEIDSDQNFSAPVKITTTANSYLYPGSLPARTTIYWRVYAKNSYGNFSQANIGAFQIGNVDYPPEPPKASDAGTFIRDVTIPDGSIVSTGQSAEKTWRMQNTGSTTWGSGYQLVFLRGDRMGAPASINVPSTAPGQNVDLSVSITSPSSTGTYAGYWRLRNPQGTYFGPEIWVNISVKAASAYISVLETDPVSPVNTNKVRIHARADNFPNLRAMRIKIDGTIIGEIGAPEIWAEWSTDGYTSGVHNIVVEAADNTDLNWTHPEVKGMVFTLQGNTASTNHAPNLPTLTNPGDWAVYQGTGGITLSAQANGDPDGDAVNQYYFEIYNSHDTPNSGWINSSSWNPPGLGIYGYQWHVKVRDSRGAESGWSETRHFTVNDPNPQIYSFYSQTCRPSWNQGDPDKICFCASTNTGTLQLQLNSATDGSENGTWKVINELGTSNYSCNLDTDSPPTLDPKELASGTHRVRLYARMNGGWANAKTQDITISVGNLRPNLPMAITLTNGAYTNSQDVTLRWNATQRTSNYRVEVSSDAGFASHLVDQTVASSQTTLNVRLDSAYSTVYWKVTAIGPYGSNTATNMFHVDIAPPDTSISVASSTVYEDNFAVNWTGGDSGSGFQWYAIQTLDQSRPNSEWQDWQMNTTQVTAIFKGLAGHTYLFRIRGMDQVGNWQDWPSTNGARQISVKIDPASRPPEPWWNDSYSYKRSLTVLNNDVDWMPPHYPVHVRFTLATTPTAAEIYNASQSNPKGNDLRLIYNNTTELNRIVQRFTSDQIDIWFPLQNGLSGGDSAPTSYQLYYGNANAGDPPANVNAVFLPAADGNTMGLWHFQEGGGSSVIDSSGRGHNGTFFAPGWVDGQTGWAGLFNGAGSYVDAGNSNDFNLVTGPMTIEAWVYLTSRGNFPHVISKWGQDGSYFLRLLDGRSPHFSMRGGGELSGGDLALNRWYHIAATYDGSSIARLYINGQQQTVKTGVGDGILTAHRLFIGWAEQGYDGGYFPGYIQHVRISNVERSDFSYARIDVQPSVAAGTQQTKLVLGGADLAVLSLNTYPNPDGGILVTAEVKNQGNISTTNSFYTDLYIDHLPSGVGDYAGSLQFWINDPIPSGSTVILTTAITDLSPIGLAASSPGEEKRGVLYVQTDSTGALNETDKANNITASGMEVCIVSPDAFEGDETYESAHQLDASQLHNFDHPNDEDWGKIVAKQGQTYRIQTLNLGPNADTYLYLYGPDGTALLASNDDYGSTLASQIEWLAPADGTYFIQARQWNPSSSGCGSSYSIGVEELDTPDDADLGFRPDPNGYSFKNYGEKSFSDFTLVELRRLFGDEHVCTFNQPYCIPRFSAERWLDNLHIYLRDGLSDGMAVSSLRLFVPEYEAPDEFNRGANDTYDLKQTNVSQYIAGIFARQITDPVRDFKATTVRQSPSQIVTELISALYSQNSDPQILILRKIDSGYGIGHAVTPYAIRNIGGGSYQIKVYDSNYPGDVHRFVVVNIFDDTWSYAVREGEIWSGSASSHTLGLVPISKYDQEPKCPWCNTGQSDQVVEISSYGTGMIFVTNLASQKIGYQGGAFFNEIENGYAHWVDTGGETARQPIFVLPMEDEYMIEVNGEMVMETYDFSVTQFGPGYMVGVDRIPVNAISHDQIKVSKDGSSMVYQSNGNIIQPKISLVTETESLSQQVVLDGVDFEDGDRLELHVIKEQSQIIIDGSNIGSGDLDFSFSQVTAEGKRSFLHKEFAIQAGAVYVIDYSDWDGVSDLEVEIDNEADGVIDEVQSLGNHFWNGIAFVDDVNLNLEGDMPVVELKGTLPTPCNALKVDVLEPDQNGRIDINVYSKVTPGKMCVQRTIPFEYSVELNTLQSGSYTVLINDKFYGNFTIP